MLVGVIAPLAVDDIIRLLEWPTIGVADLIVADGCGSGRAVIDEDGVHHMPTPPSTSESAPNRPEEAVVRTLDELWRRGVHTRDVVVLVDELSKAPHQTSPCLSPTWRRAGVVVDDGVRPLVGVASLTGGLARLRPVLDDQQRRRRQRSLPERRPDLGGPSTSKASTQRMSASMRPFSPWQTATSAPAARLSPPIRASTPGWWRPVSTTARAPTAICSRHPGHSSWPG
jgi:hypothetical protein